MSGSIEKTVVTKAYLALSIAIIAGSLSSACRCQSDKASSKKPAVPSASASVAAPAPEPPERRQLAERTAPNTDALISARKKLLDALTQVRALGAQKKGAEALSLVTESRKLDPLGSLIAVEASRAASLAGDTALAVAWARRALEGAPPKTLIEATQSVLEKAPVEAPGADVGSFDSIKAACAALEQRVQADKPPPLGHGPVASAKCEVEYELDLDAPNLAQASALRVTSADKAVVMAWVGLQTPTGIKVYGPVNSVYVPPEYRLLNDFVVDLQKVDVLPQGGPEIVVKMDERRTFADLGLNELAEVDQTRVLLLSLDRGKLEGSRDFVLSRTESKKLIDTKDRRLPAGYKPSPNLGKDNSYSMAVAWTGANEITLTKGSGSGEPRDSGRIVLFQ